MFTVNTTCFRAQAITGYIPSPVALNQRVG